MLSVILMKLKYHKLITSEIGIIRWSKNGKSSVLISAVFSCKKKKKNCQKCVCNARLLKMR